MKICEIGSQFITKHKVVGLGKPCGVDAAAAFHFQRKGSRPYERLGRKLGHGFQQPDVARCLGYELEPLVLAAVATAHVDVGFWLIRCAPMRLEGSIPRIQCVAVISLTAVLAIWRQFCFIGKRLEFVLVGPHQIAYEPVGALQIKAMCAL